MNQRLKSLPAVDPEGRRNFLRLSATVLAGAALSPVRPTLAASESAPGATLQAQKLAWAGVRLALGKDTLFLDPLVDPNAWGPALQDALVPIVPGEGSRYVLISHRHPSVNGADRYARIPDAEAQFIAAAARQKIDVKILRPGGAVTWR